MALINRISRLFKADFNAVLDHIEEPAVLLKQSLREMEEQLAQDERQLKAMDRERGQIAARIADAEHSLSETEQELDICFKSSKEDLARTLVKRKLEMQRCKNLLARKRETIEQSLAAVTARLNQNRIRLEDLRQKIELLNEENHENHSPEDNWSIANNLIKDEDVEVAFLREKQKRSPT